MEVNITEIQKFQETMEGKSHSGRFSTQKIRNFSAKIAVKAIHISCNSSIFKLLSKSAQTAVGLTSSGWLKAISRKVISAEHLCVALAIPDIIAIVNPNLGEEEVVGVADGTIRKSIGDFL